MRTTAQILMMSMSLHAAMAEVLRYPEARRDALVEELHGEKVADPYRWMEDIDGAETRKWVEAQAELAGGYLRAIPQREKFLERLRQLQDYDKLGIPRLTAGRLFYSRKQGLQNQAVVYWREDGKEGAAETVLLDPNTLSKDGTVALGGYDLTDDGKMMAYTLSEAGSDWVTIHVRDVASGKDTGEVIRWVKFSGPSWSHDGKGFYYSRYEQPEKGSELKAENYNQKVYYHVLGEPQEKDRLVYARPDFPKWGLNAAETEDGRYLMIFVREGTKPEDCFFYRDLSQGPDAPVVELLPGFEAEWNYLGNEGTRFYFLTTHQAPNRRVVVIDVAKPGREHWQEIVPGGASVIESASMVGGRIFVQRLVEAHDEVTVCDLTGKELEKLPLPNFGSAGGFGGKLGDRETFYAVTGFDTPGAIYRYDTQTGKTVLHDQTKVKFGTKDMVVEQLWFASKDGTKVPMFVTRMRNVEKNGELPVMLYGYGGFNISLSPAFNASRIAWLEAGGVYVQVNLRGGGEFGQAWHEAGMKEKKQNVFDDFVGAAEHLIREGWTKPSRLAISGGSNGGLLVAACLLQRPDLFGCALPAVGVMDMLRFHKFTIGWAWQSEYGSPEKAEDFRVLRGYSPLHNVKSGVKYPATMVLTGDHDDRVYPAHSFKFAAELQQAQGDGAPVLLRVDLRAGHGAGKPTAKQLEETADTFAFAWKALGMP
jgi:prolyl oligopeptidase